MEKQRQVKILSIISLVLAIAGMSLGFAAFSTTLNISSSATVSPDSSNFNVIFSLGSDWHDDMDDLIDWDLSGTATGNATASSGSLYGREISKLKASFTKPGEVVTYTFYAHNIGEYDAYFRGITYEALDNGSYKKCSASTTDSTKATDSLVQAACEGINLRVYVGGLNANLGDETIFEHKLARGTSEEIILEIEYGSGSTYVDGPFNVDFSDFILNYSSIDNPLDLISFNINGIFYRAESGMTFTDWLNSSYNVNNIDREMEFCRSDDMDLFNNDETVIENDGSYLLSGACD